MVLTWCRSKPSLGRSLPTSKRTERRHQRSGFRFDWVAGVMKSVMGGESLGHDWCNFS